MKLANIIVLLILFIFLLGSCISIDTTANSKSNRVRVSPYKVIVYSNSENLIEAKLPGNTSNTNIISLPGSLKPESLKIYANNQRLERYSLQSISFESEQQTNNSKNEEFLLEIPNIDKYKEIILKYSVKDLKWEMGLDINIIDNKKAYITLQAVLSTGENAFSECLVELSLAKPSLIQETSNQIINLGQINSKVNQQLFYVIESAEIDYNIHYEWYLSESDNINTILTFDSPFQTTFSVFSYQITARDYLLKNGRLSNTVNHSQKLAFNIGIQTLLSTYRSADTNENTGNTVRPFKHTLSYTVKSDLAKNCRLILYFRKKNGRNVKTEYNFTLEPGSSPGDFFVWNIQLKSGEKKELKFSLDTDIKDFNEFTNYGYYSGGR